MNEATDPPDDFPKQKSPTDQYRLTELPAIPMGPGLVPQIGPVGQSKGPPAATPATFICLRGPCRHYWELETYFDAGNPESTWDPEIGLKDADGKPVPKPNQHTRTCLAHVGTETELTDDTVYNCNRWSPLTPREVKKLTKLRRTYFRRHPEHDPSFVPAGRLAR